MIPKHIIDKVINRVKAFLPEVNLVTVSQIEDEVSFVISREEYSNYNKDELKNMAVNILKTQYTMIPDGFRILELDDPSRKKPWINSKISDRDFWAFWTRYKNYLLYKEGFSVPVVDEIDSLTNRILDGLYDPTANVGFDKKGLVVGQVQSGKTSNYTGLICKASDAGYNFIIVLAGLHNNLRSQTQLRIDKGFLGFDTQFQRAFDTGQHLIGVGVGNSGLPAHSMTDSSERGDFSKKSASISFQTKDPIIAVIKKNSSVLKKLFQWLSNYTTEIGDTRLIHEKAILIIDDEADNASINTKKNPEERTAINGWIRDILNLFAKNAYVGYTATPFANVFIPSTERNDLFPRDFIVNIPPPPKYIGPDKVFGFDFYDDTNENDNSEILPICFRIDNDEKGKSDLAEFPSSGTNQDSQLCDRLPASLNIAIKCFIITCAIRKLRGQDKEHNSMLIHVARFKRWQNHVKELVEKTFKIYRNGISYNDPLIIEELREVFESDFNGYKSYKTISNEILHSKLKDIDPYIQDHEWDDVKKFLYEASLQIKVRVINGSSADVLDYYENRDNGLSVIAIGGDKLSRGLTLEGLSISYFMRASRMYDTLMQMGRWFGYRHGYVDLCRLFTTKSLNEWFCHITRATQELRNEFDYMHDIKASPDKYAIKVRTHPNGLQISASNKIRSAEFIDISWAGRLVESYELLKDYNVTKRNLESLESLISKINLSHIVKDLDTGSRVWYDVKPDFIIELFESIKVYENLKAYNPENQIRFIKSQLKNNELTHWRVALMSNSKASFPQKRSVCGKDVGFFKRTASEESNEEIYYIKKSHIIDKSHEAIDLNRDEYEKAFRLTEERWKKKDSTPQSPSGDIIRNEIRDPKNPLLLLYLLQPSEADPDNKYGGINWDIPFVGYAISYPNSKYYEPVQFAISNTLLPFYDTESNTLDFDDEA